MNECDERVLDHQKINYGNCIDEMKDDEGFQDEVKKVNTLPLQLAVFISSNSERIMNNFIHAIGGFFTIDVYYRDTDSLYIENKRWDKLDTNWFGWKEFFTRQERLQRRRYFLWSLSSSKN